MNTEPVSAAVQRLALLSHLCLSIQVLRFPSTAQSMQIRPSDYTNLPVGVNVSLKGLFSSVIEPCSAHDVPQNSHQISVGIGSSFPMSLINRQDSWTDEY